MRREYSIRFQTEQHDDRVPLDVYAKSLSELAQALNSTRNMLAHRIAKSIGRSAASVKHALLITARTPERGSNCVPLEVGDQHNELGLDHNIAELFWQGCSSELNRIGELGGDVRNGDLPATAAEHFANAGEIANGAHISVELATRTGRKDREWTSSSNISRLVESLRTYSKRLRELRMRDAQVIGKLIAISFDPLQAQIETSAGRQWIRFRRELKDAFVARAEQYVIVDVEAQMSESGSMQHSVATDVSTLVVSRNIVEDFRNSRGLAGELWRQHADEYLEQIRQK